MAMVRVPMVTESDFATVDIFLGCEIPIASIISVCCASVKPSPARVILHSGSTGSGFTKMRRSERRERNADESESDLV